MAGGTGDRKGVCGSYKLLRKGCAYPASLSFLLICRETLAFYRPYKLSRDLDPIPGSVYPRQCRCPDVDLLPFLAVGV